MSTMLSAEINPIMTGLLRIVSARDWSTRGVCQCRHQAQTELHVNNTAAAISVNLIQFQNSLIGLFLRFGRCGFD